MKKTEDNRRITRMEKEVQQTVANYLISGFQSEIHGFTTVTSVRMPGDLRTAKVYVSILVPHDSEARLSEEILQKKLLADLQRAAPEFQNFLAQQLKTRFCPKLSFYLDDTTEHVLKVERILHDLEVERKSRKPESE